MVHIWKEKVFVPVGLNWVGVRWITPQRKWIHPHYMLISLSFSLNNNTFAPAVSLRQTTRGRVELQQPRKPLSSVQSLWEQLIRQHHYEPLISWPAPVLGGPGFRWAPLSRPPPPSLSGSWGEVWGSPFMEDDRQGSSQKRRQLWWERERRECVPMSPLCF